MTALERMLFTQILKSTDVITSSYEYDGPGQWSSCTCKAFIFCSESTASFSSNSEDAASTSLLSIVAFSKKNQSHFKLVIRRRQNVVCT